MSNSQGLSVVRYKEGSISGWMVSGYLRGKNASGKPIRVRRRFKGKHAKAQAQDYKVVREASDKRNLDEGELRVSKISTESEHVILDLVLQLREKLDEPDELDHVLLGKAVRHFIQDPNVDLEQVTVQEAMDRYLSRKAADVLSSKHGRGVKSKLNAFSSLYGDRPLSSITADEVDEWVEDRNVSARTKETYYNALHAMFAWCQKQCLVVQNVVGRTDKPIPPEYGEPKTILPEQLGDLLRYAHEIDDASMIPYFVFAAFAAVRPEEVARAEWDDFDWDENMLRVRHRKGGEHYLRAVEIPKAGMEWLEHVGAEKLTGKVRPKNGVKLFNLIRACAGFRIGKGSLLSMDLFGFDDLIEDSESESRPEWPPNALRKFGITYRYKDVRNIHEVAEWAGNSPKKIKMHYQTVRGASKRTTEDYFNLTPDNVLS